MPDGDHSKRLYKQLRALPWSRLWTERVTRFDQAPPKERLEGVSWIRAVGVVFAESGPSSDKAEVTQWLLQLLKDPEERIRRYAMAALPKVGAGAAVEAELLALTRTAINDREEAYVGRALGKLGGAATAAAIAGPNAFSVQTVQRVKAAVARGQGRSRVLLDRTISNLPGLRIHLRGRRGLEGIVSQEVKEKGRFSVVEVSPGLVVVRPPASFSLADVFALRCFSTAGFVLDRVDDSGAGDLNEALAAAIASPLTLQLLETLTEGSLRYRLDFVDKGHQRGAVRVVASRAFELCPRILNDAREAPWAIDIHSTEQAHSVELRPRLSPDPRHTHRLDDVPAASHPPLAACMAYVAGKIANESVWDPFCGSGLELIERARLGGVRKVYGTDRSAEAIGIAERNFHAARISSVEAHFTCCDFRDFARLRRIAPNTLTLVITNPPLGRRVPIPNLRGLFNDLFASAAALLQPGGRLVLTNPFQLESHHPSLKREFSQVVDLGGFDCRLELYRKS
ncbi:MAG: methyltransferase [Verrucomicrobia bacterium]|nr:methyltransferase [Verrucomicrobiota bacterium]MBI3871029.1 methyltransferase [Verrucomicrobiota bacterium]